MHSFVLFVLSSHTVPSYILDTRHTGRFLSVWMMLLPAALYQIFVESNAPTTFLNLQCLPIIPATVIVGIFLFGIDELAMQLEEPFSILPMQKFCNQVKDSNKALTDTFFPF